MWPWMCGPSARDIRCEIKRRKQEIKTCKGDYDVPGGTDKEGQLLVALYKLWCVRGQLDTIWNRLVTWWTRESAIAGCLLYHCESDEKLVEREFGCKPSAKTLKRVAEILNVRKELKQAERAIQEQEEIRRLPGLIGKLDYDLHQKLDRSQFYEPFEKLVKRVEALEGKKRSKGSSVSPYDASQGGAKVLKSRQKK